MVHIDVKRTGKRHRRSRNNSSEFRGTHESGGKKVPVKRYRVDPLDARAAEEIGPYYGESKIGGAGIRTRGRDRRESRRWVDARVIRKIELSLATEADGVGGGRTERTDHNVGGRA